MISLNSGLDLGSLRRPNVHPWPGRKPNHGGLNPIRSAILRRPTPSPRDARKSASRLCPRLGCRLPSCVTEMVGASLVRFAPVLLLGLNAYRRFGPAGRSPTTIPSLARRGPRRSAKTCARSRPFPTAQLPRPVAAPPQPTIKRPTMPTMTANEPQPQPLTTMLASQPGQRHD